MYFYTNEGISPREAIEVAIEFYQPNISDEQLVRIRESIMQKISFNHGILYVEDNFLYTRKRFGEGMNVGGGPK